MCDLFIEHFLNLVTLVMKEVEQEVKQLLC
jgi:hypothetical protein